MDVISEARLNLVIYYLRQDDVSEAYALIKDLEPTVPQEYILKGVVNAAVGEYIDQPKNIWCDTKIFVRSGERVAGASEDSAAVLPAGGRERERV